MGEKPRPRAPDGLKARGRAYWDHVLGEYELSESEVQILREVCRSLDLVEELARVVRRDGAVVGSDSRLRTHPAVAELRQQRLALHRLLAALNLPTDSIESPATLRARRAAQSRWKDHVKREDQVGGVA